jgi:hypothetical protein
MFTDVSKEKMKAARFSQTTVNIYQISRCYIPDYSTLLIFMIIRPRRMRWAGLLALMGENIIAFRVLVGKSEENRTLGSTRFIWKDTIKWVLKN